MTIQHCYQQLLSQLFDLYDTREAANITDMIIEKVTGQRKIDRIMYKTLPVSSEQQKQLEQYMQQLLQHRPVQYVLGEAWFMNMLFSVNEHTLIPRPETEELVQWILDDINRLGHTNVSVIDIGTGSGCIAVAIKKLLPAVEVSAVDVSEQALQMARLNSIQHHTLIDFLQLDFLNTTQWKQLGRYNLVVSNPPYIATNETATMNKNVVNYEPGRALFVPDNDVLVFYKALAAFGKHHLKPSGSIYTEINEAYGKEVVGLFEQQGYTEVVLRQDMQQKDRMVHARLP